MTSPTSPQRASAWPGVALALAAALLAYVINQAVPVLSALLVAIVLGIVVGNVRPLGPWFSPGMKIAQKQLLRAGIVLLGLKVSLGDIASLGLPTVLLVVGIVGVGLIGSYLIGRALKLDEELAMLVACGFSICGAAAVAAVDGVIKPRREAVATALGLVVLFGTAMIAVVPALSAALHLDPAVAAVWAGGGTHEVAQVVAIGGVMGGGALLTTAVIVKLARVVMLAPVMVGVGLWQRRRAALEPDARRPPLVPLFVLGFLVAATLRTVVPMAPELLRVADLAQTLLLGAGMFALGLGVNKDALAKTSRAALVLGVLSTLLVNAIALGGGLLIAG